MAHAPIHLLPDDVLREVFILCIELADTPKSYYRRTPSYSYRVSLSSTCRRWRGIIQTMPRVWANITYDLMDDYPPAPLLHLVMERSDPTLIHVDLFGVGDLHTSYPIVNPMINPGVSYTSLIESLNSLSPHIYRCRRLKIFITDPDVANAFVAIPFTAADQLEELELASQCDQNVEDRIFSALRGLTALRKLTLIGFWEHTSSVQQAISTLPWHQLLHLDISYPIPTEEVFWLLQNCTSATTMRIRAKMQVGHDGPAIYIPNLRELSLSVCGRNIYRSLRKIEAPKLEVFCLGIRREASIYETPAEIPSNDQFIWPSALNRQHSLKIIMIQDPSSTYVEATELLSKEHVKVVPVVQVGIRPAEVYHAQRLFPDYFNWDNNMLGWVDKATARRYTTNGRGFISMGLPM